MKGEHLYFLLHPFFTEGDVLEVMTVKTPIVVVLPIVGMGCVFIIKWNLAIAVRNPDEH
jgi:hypothetical protein